MPISKDYLIPEKAHGVRLDVYLASHFALSREKAQKAIKEGNVWINRKSIKKNSYLLQEGDSLRFQQEKAPPLLKKIKTSLEILYEDESLLVINKAPGIAVHPSPSLPLEKTLLSPLRDQIPSLKSWKNTDRPGLIHRLDKDTSGVLLIAKSEEAHQKWSKAFRDRQVEKIYLALVLGRPRTEKGKITASLKRSSRNRTQMAIHDQGKNAYTEFKVLESYPGRSLLEVKIKTGRTHQIRLHLASIGHPVLGDISYGDHLANETARKELGLKRQFLHAKSIQAEGHYFEAPLPKDLEKVLQELKSQHSKK